MLCFKHFSKLHSMIFTVVQTMFLKEKFIAFLILQSKFFRIKTIIQCGNCRKAFHVPGKIHLNIS